MVNGNASLTNDEDTQNTIVMILIACFVIVGLYFAFQYTCTGGTNNWEDGTFTKCFIIPGLDFGFGGGGGGGNGSGGGGGSNPPGFTLYACDSPQALNSKTTCVSNSYCAWDTYAGSFGQCVLEGSTLTTLDCSKFTTSDLCPIGVCRWDDNECKFPAVRTPCYDIVNDVSACLSNGCVVNTYANAYYGGTSTTINDAKDKDCVYHPDELTPFECTNLTKEACITDINARREHCEWHEPSQTCINTNNDNATRCLANFLRCAGGTIGGAIISQANYVGGEVEEVYNDVKAGVNEGVDAVTGVTSDIAQGGGTVIDEISGFFAKL